MSRAYVDGCYAASLVLPVRSTVATSGPAASSTPFTLAEGSLPTATPWKAPPGLACWHLLALKSWGSWMRTETPQPGFVQGPAGSSCWVSKVTV